MYTFLIKPTNNCNLRCKYCFIDNQIKSSSGMMTIDLAKITIDKIANLLSESNENTCKITWHGGEPLLWGRNNYEKILSYMFETYPHINWINAMQTNLTLLSDDLLEVFQKYGVQF